MHKSFAIGSEVSLVAKVRIIDFTDIAHKSLDVLLVG
jgi:hypothetical protein